MERPLRRILSVAALCFAFASSAFARQQQSDESAVRMADAATALLGELNATQKKICQFKLDDPERLNWHFIPRDRKGLSFRDLEGSPRAAARKLLSTGLTGAGFERVLKVMSLEEVLYLLEGGDEAKRRERRHPHRYHISVFGTPGKTGRWSWRVEGHHLSLNYLIENGQFVSSTPEFFGANPGTISAGKGRLLRVLGDREDLGRRILKSCDDDQKKIAWIDKKPPREIRTPGKAQPMVGKPVGLKFADMTNEQQATFRKLLDTYLICTPAEIRTKRLQRIEKADIGKVHFAWWGGADLNEPHHYRIQGPTFIVEYNNVQNNANHVHSIWRNTAGDFGVPLK